MNREDPLGFQRREEDENVTNRKNRNPINEITGIQNLMRRLVDTIHPSCHKIMIKINGEGAID